MPEDPHPTLAVALDIARPAEALALAQRLDPALARLKVGKELFVRGGPQVVKSLQALGFEIFLDLKFHDIPNTVAAAVRAAADLGVWMVNVHAAGGRRMLDAARKAAVPPADGGPLLIGVTVLTSMEDRDLAETGVGDAAEAQVERLARLCEAAGLDGVVCSARELPLLRRSTAPGFLTVTPGIRPATTEAGDQRRVMTPEAAIVAGADVLVIGRPIVQATDPERALRDIHASIARAARDTTPSTDTAS